MDLASLEPDDGTTVHLRHPVSREPLESETGASITIDVAGMDSDAFRVRQRAITNKRLAGTARKPLTAEQLEEERIGTLVACVTGWSNIELDGEVLTFSRENVRRLLSRPKMSWVRDQLDEAIADRGNFLKASPTS